jgi:hypothetical protein
VRRLSQEPDQIASRRIVAVGIGSILVFATGVVAAWIVLGARMRVLEPNGPTPATHAGRPQVALVNQRLFEQPQTEAWRAAQRGRLESYGWVDRDRGIIHIPIERAIDLVLAEEKAK